MTHRTAAAVLTIGLLITAPACRGGGAKPAAVPFVPVDPSSGSATDRAIATAQQRLQVVPQDTQARLDLADAFLQKAREVADPTLYIKAGGLLTPLLKKDPNNPAVLIAAG